MYYANVSSQVTQLNVFIASPSELAKEREIVRNVCADVNSTVGPYRSVILNPVSWETHCWPDVGHDSQAVILAQIQPEDIFVGILWNKFGTPTPRAASGTAEEFALAYKRWQENNVSHLLIYFKKPSRLDNLDDLRQVSDFKKNVAKRGLLYWEFSKRFDFERYLLKHLTNIVLRRTSLPFQGSSQASSIDLPQLTRYFDAQLLIDAHTDLIYLDLDDFAKLNQKLGIPKADEVLQTISKMIISVCKPEGLVNFRVLGDQFAVFVPGRLQAMEIAEELRKQIELGTRFGVTASIGVARNKGMKAEEMVLIACRAAYQSKRNGKNRVTSETQVSRSKTWNRFFESS